MIITKEKGQITAGAKMLHGGVEHGPTGIQRLEQGVFAVDPHQVERFGQLRKAALIGVDHHGVGVEGVTENVLRCCGTKAQHGSLGVLGHRGDIVPRRRHPGFIDRAKFCSSKGMLNVLVRLLRLHLRRYRRMLAVVMVLQFVQTMAFLLLPRLNARIIDRGIATGDRGYIWRTGLVMLAVTLVQVVFSIGAVYYGARAAMGFGRDVRRDLFHRVTDYSAREMNQFGASSLITRITNDVQQVQMLVVMGCTMMIAAPITTIGGTVMALREDVGVSALLLVSIPALILLIGRVVVQMVPLYRRMQERIDIINRILREQIVGIRVVRAFVREPDEAVRFADANADLTDTSLQAGRLMSRMFPTVMFVMNVSMVAAVWIGAGRIKSGAMQVGALVAFLTYLAQILGSVMMATFVVMMIPRATVSATRILEVLDTDTSLVPAAAPIHELISPTTLEFRDVRFQYPGAESPVVDRISFTVRAGETLAVIGSTGSGKTTLTQLAARLIDPTAGVVCISDVDVRDLAPEVLWSRIGLVPQRPFLFSGTVATNLRFGKPDATDDELWEALDIAQATDFVRAMPGGLDAAINQGGSNVSGGQRQRLAIARALVHKPEIYLFDDSFSALDLATDARLRAALAPHTREAIVMLVAQRVSTIAKADQILVLEDGEVVGLGTHGQLLSTCETYQEIVSSQITAEELAA
jgi:ATP-binding cassette, subfamily B, multidrug efflux pump